MTTDSAEPQNHDSLWTCTKEELQAELDNYAGEFGVEKWTAKNAAHFLELKFHLVRDTIVTKAHIDEILRVTKSDDLDTREYRMVTVLAVLENEFIFKTPDDIEVLYLYQDGIYVEANTIIKARVEELLQDKANSHFCNEVLEHFKRRSYVPRERFNQFGGLIPVKNGLLNLSTAQLEEYDPEKIFTFKIDVNFDATADCPQFKTFLNQILSVVDEQHLLQEFSGYTLLPAFPHHKFMVLVGSGRNGKGAFVRTLEGVLGKDCTTDIPLEFFDGQHRFQLYNLYGSLMNACPEPTTVRPFPTETLKKITGKDRIEAEIKNKQKSVKFTSFTKFFVSANHLPVVNDTTPSFWERVLIMEFKECFTEEKGNSVLDIEEIWLNNEQERSGILNWMIEGLKRLTEKKRFTHTKSQDEMMLLFKQSSDPIGAFLSDSSECIYDATLFTTRETLYGRYKHYVESLGLPAESAQKLAERVRKMPGVTDRRMRVEGANQRAWKGIGLAVKAPDDQTDLLDSSGSLGSLGSPLPYSSILREKTENNRMKECTTGVPDDPSDPVVGRSDFHLSDNPEGRWTDFLGRVERLGKRELLLSDMDSLFTPQERGIIDRDLTQWEKEGRVCWVIDEHDRAFSHWKVMEGDLP